METTLTRAAGRSISDREISSALATRFREWRGTWRDFDRDPDPLAGQHAARFRDPAWTWRR
jgi:hypothetical protein